VKKGNAIHVIKAAPMNIQVLNIKVSVDAAERSAKLLWKRETKGNGRKSCRNRIRNAISNRTRSKRA